MNSGRGSAGEAKQSISSSIVESRRREGTRERMELVLLIQPTNSLSVCVSVCRGAVFSDQTNRTEPKDNSMHDATRRDTAKEWKDHD